MAYIYSFIQAIELIAIYIISHGMCFTVVYDK